MENSKYNEQKEIEQLAEIDRIIRVIKRENWTKQRKHYHRRFIRKRLKRLL